MGIACHEIVGALAWGHHLYSGYGNMGNIGTCLGGKHGDTTLLYAVSIFCPSI